MFANNVGNDNCPFRLGSILDYYKSKDPMDIVKSNGTEQERLTSDGKLPDGWEARNDEFTSQILSEYSYLNWLWIVFDDRDQQCEYLRFLVNYMKDIMHLCDSLGECFSYWRSKKLFGDNDFIDRAGALAYLEEFHGKCV